MAYESKIQWTEATWNPWHGCTKVSPGCKYCYMYRDKERYRQDPTTVIRAKDFAKPLKWNDARLIFTCSWSDFFITDADEWRKDAWEVIRKTPQHTYQILTKRPSRILGNLPSDWGSGYSNVWLGVSVENSDYLARIDVLRAIPAKVRFISAEPLIGPLGEFSLSGIHWVIVGGESGNETGSYKYRPCNLNWIDQIIKTSKKWDVPIFVKQLGTHIAKEIPGCGRHGGEDLERHGFPRGMPNTHKGKHQLKLDL